MTYFSRITLHLETSKPQETDEECEARANEFDMIHDKIALFFEQSDGFLPSGWTAEVE